VIWQSRDIPGPEFIHPKLKIFICRARAVSLARNLGAYETKAEWIWFLDDDTMPASATYLDTARRTLESSRSDFLTSNVCGEGADQVCRRISADVQIDEKTIAGNFWEPGLIIRRSVFLQIPYDICLGPGCLHGSSEGTDLGMRLLWAGYRGMRIRDLELDHPRIEKTADYRNKIFFYALGNGLTAIRYGRRAGYSRAIVKSLIKIAVSGALFRRRAFLDHIARLCGLVAGPCLQPGPPINLEVSLLYSPDVLHEFADSAI
jgi:GT2 family glycosyltransferase